MIYESSTIKASLSPDAIARICFDSSHSVNKFDQATLLSLSKAVDAAVSENAKGIIFHSSKNAFIVGADITEFLGLFKQPDQQIFDWLQQANEIFNKIEDLPIPTICCINGFALGGGFELPLATSIRIADTTAQVGLPETKLGIIPGWGGTVRLPRLIGADNAIELMATGRNLKAQEALSLGAIDAVVSPEHLLSSAEQMMQSAIKGDINWQEKSLTKQAPLKLSEIEALMSFSTAKAMVAAKAGKHYPAPLAALSSVENSYKLSRAEALINEHNAFISVCKTDAAKALIGIFLNDQLIKSKAKQAAKLAAPIQQAAVLGAGIMGGGIAYQSALKGTPITMKDISNDALDLGISTAQKLLGKRLKKGRISAEKMASTLSSIKPTLNLSDISDTQIVVEAVVENPKIKASVISEVESVVSDTTIIASNTSTISIDKLAESVNNPSRFCGMHFFNPVDKMPLVEVIRSKHSSDETIASVVAYATKMGKSAIVVNDCPGFFVNRVLFPYFAGFNLLLNDGADYLAIDKVMTKEFGWPMGPAHLLDVVGIDTGCHAQKVMAEGFPTRMPFSDNDATSLLFNKTMFGQKTGEGFYAYGVDKRGRPTKTPSVVTQNLIAQAYGETKQFDKEEIIARTMIPMIIETVRCLEENIIASAAEADMALVYGLGFPPFRGGVFTYLDTMGIDNFVALADKYQHLGELYQVTDNMRKLAAEGSKYYPQA